MSNRKQKAQSGGSLEPVGSASEDIARIIQAWNDGVEKWYKRHDSIPAAFVELAHVIDGIQKHTASPNDQAQRPALGEK